MIDRDTYLLCDLARCDRCRRLRPNAARSLSRCHPTDGRIAVSTFQMGCSRSAPSRACGRRRAQGLVADERALRALRAGAVFSARRIAIAAEALSEEAGRAVVARDARAADVNGPGRSGLREARAAALSRGALAIEPVAAIRGVDAVGETGAAIRATAKLIEAV